MEFIISKQIAVEAETPEEAVAKINDGKTIALSVSQRPQQAAQGMQSVKTFSTSSGVPQTPKLNG